MSRGSSPLTRGKLAHDTRTDLTAGLIPAHAGKTDRSLPRLGFTRAHPRSRGENVGEIDTDAARLGSSPLTRGKHHTPRPDSRAVGLIPAHAGKTRLSS